MQAEVLLTHHLRTIQSGLATPIILKNYGIYKHIHFQSTIKALN